MRRVIHVVRAGEAALTDGYHPRTPHPGILMDIHEPKHYLPEVETLENTFRVARL